MRKKLAALFRRVGRRTADGVSDHRERAVLATRQRQIANRLRYLDAELRAHDD